MNFKPQKPSETAIMTNGYQTPHLISSLQRIWQLPLMFGHWYTYMTWDSAVVIGTMGKFGGKCDFSTL